MQGLFLLPKEIYAGIAIFYGSLLLSSFINLDMTGVKKTFDFFTWTIPLWLILITAGKYKIQKGAKYGIVIGTIFLCGVGLFQFYQGYVNGNAEIRIQANFGNANLLAMALEILFPFSDHPMPNFIIRWAPALRQFLSGIFLMGRSM